MICPNCKHSIHEVNFNHNAGIAKCMACGVTSPLISEVEQQQALENTFFHYDKVASTHSFHIPSAGWERSGSKQILLFAILFLAFGLVPILIYSETPGFIFLFLIVGLLFTIHFLFLLKGSLDLQIDPQTIELKWSLFGIHYNRHRATRDWEMVEEDVLYRRNGRPIKTLVLSFRKGGKLKLSSSLTEEDRIILLQQLRTILRK